MEDFLVAQISDLHVVDDDSAFMSSFVNAASGLTSALAHLHAMRRRPDVIVATGDLTDHGTAPQYERLASLLAVTEIPVYLVPGNHDERAPFLAAFAGAGGRHRYLPTDPARGAHWVVEDLPVRIVGVDTTTPGFHDGWLGDDDVAWLDGVLASAPDRPTLVAMHHPPFATGIWWMDAIGLTGAGQFESVVRRHPQVGRVICGHIHRPITTTWGATAVVVAASTAHQTRLDLGPDDPAAMTDEAPQVALHHWNGSAWTSHTAVVGPRRTLEISSLVSDWANVVSYLRTPQRRAKGGGFA